MINVAAAFGGGLLLRQKLEEIQLPKLTVSDESQLSFKLTVRAVAASVPGIGKPGFVSRQRPQLQVSLGDIQKETELADYEESSSSGSGSGACSSKDCPWRFGDTLTFKVGMNEVIGPGLRLKLNARSDMQFGPVQVQMSRVDEIGEASVDLRRRVLPGCVPVRGRSWESPVLLIPLAHVRGGIVNDDQALGQAVAHVAVSFVMDMEPEIVLAAAEAETRTVSDVLASKADGLMQWLSVAEESFGQLGSPVSQDKVGQAPGSAFKTLTPYEAIAASSRVSKRVAPDPGVVLADPELDPEGWISRKGPNGRYHWHHRSLGPAPWEEVDGEPAHRSQIARNGRKGVGFTL